MDLKKLLQEIDLLDYFPDKLKRQDLFLFPECHFNKNKDSKLKSLFSKFVNDLLHYDSNCRFIDVEPFRETLRGFRSRMKNEPATEVNTPPVHPLDLSTLIFLSCDPVARQDIVCRFWSCRHAFPFIVQLEQLTSPKLYIWPFRGLIAKSDENRLDERVEKAVSQMQFKVVSFLRFGENVISKSDIINFVINRSAKGSSVFFHRNCTGSAKARCEITAGMVEAFPYMYSRQDGGPTLYLNLRGNALNYKTQRLYLLNISNITVILLERKDLENVECFIAGSRTRNENVKVLLLTDVSAHIDDEDLISKFCEIEQSLDVCLIPIGHLRLPKIVHEITKCIHKNKTVAPLERFVTEAKDLEIDVDEEDIKEYLDDAKNVSNVIEERYELRSENVLLPVQGKECLQLARLELEFYKLRCISRTETVYSYREKLQKDKHKCREVQYSLTLNESLTTLLIERCKSRGFDIMLRSLKLHFEYLCRVNVNKLLSDYKALFTAMRISDRGAGMGKWNNKLKELDERMNSNALSISDFVREMGQIFESRKWFQNREQREVPASTSAEVKTAVHILLEGYPIELMDGRSCSVPLDWIKAVLTELRLVIGKARLKVISVLGVESSGKSTLLNIMFGSIFPVGSGRCTRGVYVHLLKTVSESKKLDYVLVVDTEGLFSSATYLDEAAIRDKQERELATFVIGLSNLTLVNIMGENVDYLKDILPISVYAFLRMNLVGLNPKCKLLHHNVDKSRKHALVWQAKLFENELNKYTEEACVLEKVPMKQFKDVILFDPAHDVYYFPSLFEANTHETDYQETVSNFYSREAIGLKTNLLKDDSFTTVDELIHNIDRLWNAVKRENFVYEFRNILDAEARAILDSKLCDFQWKIRTDIQVKVIMFQEKVCKSSSIDNLEAFKEEMKLDLDEYVRSKREQFLLTFDKYHDDYDTVLAKALLRLWSSCRQDLHKITGECVDEALDTLERLIRLREREIRFKHGDRQLVQSVEQYIEKYVTGAEIAISNRFFDPEKHFENWAYEELTTKSIMSKEQMEEDAMECLFAVFCANRTAVDDIRPLLANELDKFRPIRDHWPRQTYETFMVEQDTAYQLVKDVKNYCSKIMNNIKQRKRFYHRQFFREIALYVRNERHRLGKKLNTSHKFDVQLSAAASSHMVKQFSAFDSEKGLLSFNMVSSIKSYFLAKCLERKGGVTATKSVVEGCCHIIESKIVEQLIPSQTDKTVSVLVVHIINFMMDHYSFFRSKFGFLCFVWKQLLLENDCVRLQEYLTHPLASIKSRISNLFGKDISGIETDTPTDAALLEKIIKPLVNEQLEEICQLLCSESPSEMGYSLAEMTDFLNFLVKKFEPCLDVTDIFKYQHCCVEIADADVFVQMLIDHLRSDLFRVSLVSRIHYSVLEKNMVHDDIRLQVVDSVYSSIIGCEETCSLCGVLCCSSQKSHAGPHNALVHMPTGFRDLVSKDTSTISTSTCFDEFESYANETFRLKWTAPSDVSDEGNNLWKYMFVTHAREMAIRRGKREPENIPESWKRLTLFEVLHWLDNKIGGTTEL